MADAHAHAHPDVHPEHHFASMAQQSHAATLGMWVFLATEVLLFSGLFALYAGYRASYPAAFIEGIDHNLAWLGSTNTVVLLISSYTMARGAYALLENRPRLAVPLLLATVALAGLFLVFKGFEYADHFHHGIFAGGRGAFFEEPGHARGISLFFSFYFLTTGLHALHVLIGMGLILVFAWRIRTGRLTSAKGYQIEMVAMYWHIVDLVWIFLWPLYYLTGSVE